MIDPADAARSFGLEPILVTRLTGGLEATAWRVETPRGSFALRSHAAAADTDAAHLASELQWLAALVDDASINAPRPVRRKDGALAPHVEVADGGKVVAYWTALEWVDGAPLERLPDVGEAARIGGMIAALHARARAWSPPAGFARPVYVAARFRRAAETLLSRFARAIDPSVRGDIERALPNAYAALDALWSDAGSVGVIHADLHDGNILWSNRRPGPAPIDFGRCGLGPFLLDVAMAQHFLTPEPAADLLAGYAAASACDAVSVETLPALRLLAWVENLAVLSGFAAEVDGVVADLPLLADYARGLAYRTV